MSMQTAGSASSDTVPGDAPRRPLRRLARELILLVLAKILIWWVAIAPYARPDTRPAAIEHLLAPASASSTSHADSP
jgi:hypothetical protein